MCHMSIYNVIVFLFSFFGYRLIAASAVDFNVDIEDEDTAVT